MTGIAAAALRPARRPAAILAFHSVTSPDLPSASAVNLPVTRVISLIDTVRAGATVVPLSELVERHRAGRSTRGLAALTFDDAYVSLPALLAPYLDRYSVPITVFVASTATDRGARFWWDRVDDLFGRVSAARWRAFEDTIGLPESFRTGQPAEFGPLRPFRQWMLAACRGRLPDAVDTALSALEREVGFVTAHRAMNWDEAVTFAQRPFVDLGVHTVSHPVLPLLGDDELAREVADGYRAIRDHLPRAVPVLALPFGLYDARTVRVAAAAGMRASLALGNGTVHDLAVDDELPRLSMSTGLNEWKLLARLAGLREPQWRYPALPSATS